ncbi:MAG: DUF4160 domain-containing protein [Moraxellaceae bacterium]|jgi:hypothetical protein|nr:DUF4160 domain-containing protein [Moraxellaceae bacterium]
MPTILRFNGLRVVVYPNDHRPAHVHVIGAGCEAVFNLNCPEGQLALRESFGFSTHELNQIAERLKTEQGVLCPAWRTIHHDY